MPVMAIWSLALVALVAALVARGGGSAHLAHTLAQWAVTLALYALVRSLFIPTGTRLFSWNTLSLLIPLAGYLIMGHFGRQPRS